MSDLGGSVMGLGIMVSLYDAFTANAKRIEKQMKSLTANGTLMAAQWERSMARMKTALGVTAVGLGGMLALSVPIREAAKFETSMTRVSTIIDRNVKSQKNWADEWKRMNHETLAMGAKYGETPSAHADALYSVIAKGFDKDPLKASQLLKVANEMSIATKTPVTESVEGFLSVVNAYGIGKNASVSPEAAGMQYRRAADQIFKAMAVGGFSSNPTETDFESISRNIGKIAPMSSAVGLDFGALMSTWAVSTQGGQNGAIAATGLRQLIKDLVTPTTKLKLFTKETGWDQAKILASIRESGSLIPLLTKVREYAGFTNKDIQGLTTALANPEISRRLKELQASPDGAKNLTDSVKGNEFLHMLSDAGGIDLLKVNHVFKSIWGMTAVLPLLTTQFNNLKSTEDSVTNAQGLLADAFKEMTNTVEQQAKIVGSSWQALLVVIGTPLLKPVASALKGVATGLILLRQLAERFPAITAVIFKTIGAVSVLLFTLGLIKVVVEAWRLGSLLYVSTLGRMTWVTAIFGKTLNVAFGRIFLLIAALALVSRLTKAAWDRDFMGMRTILTRWYKDTTMTIGAVNEAWDNYRRTGKFSISEETYNNLKQSGLVGLVGNLVALTYRLSVFMEGFQRGWNKTWKGLSDGVTKFLDVIKPVSDRIPQLKNLTDLIGKLFDPSQEGVNRWEAMGELLGGLAPKILLIAAPLALLSGLFLRVWGVATRAWSALRFIWTLAGGLRPLLGMVRGFLTLRGIGGILMGLGRTILGFFGPVGWIIMGVITAVSLLVVAWRNNFLNIRQVTANTWAAVSGWFVHMYQSIVWFFQNVIHHPKQAFHALGAGIRKIGEGITVWLIEMLIKTATNLPKLMTVVGLKIFQGIQYIREHGAQMFLNAGGWLIRGLIHGVQWSWPKLMAGVKWIVDAMVGFFTGLLGIESPSKVFAGFGMNIVEGLVNGITKTWDKLKSKVSDIWTNLKDKGKSALNFVTGNGGSATGGSGATGGGSAGPKLSLGNLATTATGIAKRAIAGLSGGWAESIAGYCSRWVRQVMGSATGGKTNGLFGATAAISEQLWKKAGLTKSLNEMGGYAGLKPGDVLFQGFGSGGAGHTGIYIGDGRVAENSTRYGTRDGRGVTTLKGFGRITSVGRLPTRDDAAALGTNPQIAQARATMMQIARDAKGDGGSHITAGELQRINDHLAAMAQRPIELKVDRKTLAKVVQGQTDANRRVGGRPQTSAPQGIRR